MNNAVIDRDMMLTVGKYLLDGFLITIVWAETSFTLLSANAFWAETFGEYATAIKTTVQVIITIMIAITVFYRMMMARRKYKQGKGKADEEQG